MFNKFKKKDGKKTTKRTPRKPRVRVKLPKDAEINYRNIDLLQKFISPKGKIMSRRFTGASCMQQRDLTKALKRAKFLALLPVGSAKRI